MVYMRVDVWDGKHSHYSPLYVTTSHHKERKVA